MIFYNPAQTATIEGRIPKKEDNFTDDRYYSNIETVFVRFDPFPDYIQVTFPCESGIILKYSYEKLDEIAKKDITIFDLIKNAENVENVTTTPIFRGIKFSNEKNIFVVYKNRFQ